VVFSGGEREERERKMSAPVAIVVSNNNNNNCEGSNAGTPSRRNESCSSTPTGGLTPCSGAGSYGSSRDNSPARAMQGSTPPVNFTQFTAKYQSMVIDESERPEVLSEELTGDALVSKYFEGRKASDVTGVGKSTTSDHN